MNKKTTNAIILRRVNFSESDRILTLLTSNFGKVRAIAKGVRKEKSKLAGGLELLSISTIGYIKGRGDLDQIVSSRLEQHFASIVSDYDRVQLAYKAIEWVDKITEDDNNSQYYNFLLEALKQLDNLSLDLSVVELWLRLQILTIHGNIPNLTHDKQGGVLREGKTYTFDPVDGCFEVAKGGSFDAKIIKVWRVLATNDPARASKIKGLNENIGSSNEDLQRFMQNQMHLG